MSVKYDAIAEAYIENFIFEQYELLTESRIDFLKNQYKDKISTEHDPLAQYKDSDSIIDHLSAADPTKNKKYTQWIVGQYKKGNLKQEDTFRLTDALNTFDLHSKKLPLNSIHQYKTIESLKSAVKPFEEMEAPESNKDKKERIKHEGLEHIYGDDKIDMYHLKTKDASQQLYGGGAKIGKTDWCTAVRNENCYFDHYNEQGPLFTIHRKSDGELFQFHPDSGQFMDRHDNTIKPHDFESIKDSFHKAEEKNFDKFYPGGLF